jgi:hypothetical protein
MGGILFMRVSNFTDRSYIYLNIFDNAFMLVSVICVEKASYFALD